jgi:hypothetical protein
MFRLHTGTCGRRESVCAAGKRDSAPAVPGRCAAAKVGGGAKRTIGGFSLTAKLVVCVHQQTKLHVNNHFIYCIFVVVVSSMTVCW